MKELAELVGILLGDGCIGIWKCKSNGKIKTQYCVKVTLHSIDDLEYSKHVLDLFRKQFSTEPFVSFRKNENGMDIRIFGKRFVDYITNEVGLELAPKLHRAKIPQKFINNTLELDLIRGMFDTDGSVVITNNNGTIYPRLELKVCDSPMQAQVIDILKRNGFHFGVYRASPNLVRIQLNGKTELRKWMDKIGFSNPKYNERLSIIPA